MQAPLALFGDKSSLNSCPHCVVDYIQSLGISGAFDDYYACTEFLKAKSSNSVATFNTYRREIEHFLHWAWLQKGKTLIDCASESGVLEYFEFSRTPEPDWIGIKIVPRFKLEGELVLQNKEWKPYVCKDEELRPGLGKGENAVSVKKYVPENSTFKSVSSIISSFMGWATKRNFIGTNPMHLVNDHPKIKLSKTNNSGNDNHAASLSAEQWNYLVDYAERRANDESNLHNERNLFALVTFFLLGVRISELSASESRPLRMSSFYKDHLNLWWFKAIGKGGETRDIPVNDELLNYLVRFRKFIGLESYPNPNDNFPLLPRKDYKLNRASISVRHLRKCMTDLFRDCASSLEGQNRDDDRIQLDAAVVHWLRHTSATTQLNSNIRMDVVQKNLGHADIKTTQIYNHQDRKDQHSASKKLQTRQGAA